MYKLYIYKYFTYQKLTEVVFYVFSGADIKESTLYPILKKLEKAGYVTTYSAEYQGRKRKYYSITEAGKTQMAYLQGEWKSYRDTIDNIIEWRKKE